MFTKLQITVTASLLEKSTGKHSFQFIYDQINVIAVSEICLKRSNQAYFEVVVDIMPRWYYLSVLGVKLGIFIS